MPLPLLLAVPLAAAGGVLKGAAVAVKTAAVAVKTGITTAVKAVGTGLKTLGNSAMTISKGAVSKLSTGAKTVSTKLKSAGIQVKQRVSTSVQNRVQSRFGDTSSARQRIIKQAVQEKEPRKAEVDTRITGEMSVQHGGERRETLAEMAKITPQHLVGTTPPEPKPDVAPEAQPNARPKSKGPAMGRAA